MQKAIEQIRGVIGVSGVIIWNRQKNSFHQLLPARFTESEVKQIFKLLTTFCSSQKTDSEATIKFEKGWLLIVNRQAYAILILAKSDLNLSTINLVLKSLNLSISRQLEQVRVAVRDNSPFSVESIATLTRAINLSLAYFRNDLPRSDISHYLREAKSQLVADFPVLKKLTVDNNGGIIVIKGSQQAIDSSIVPACARLISGFLVLAGNRMNIADFNIQQQTSDLQPQLTELGFYQYFSEAIRAVEN